MSAVTRAFVAVFPPLAVREAIGARLETLASPHDGVAWVRAVNLHFTLRFLGDLTSQRLEAARHAVVATASSKDRAPFRMSLGGTGAFPGPARARVLWLGAREGATPLTLLAGALEAALVREGFLRADRPFTPHLTLGRPRDPDGAGPAVARFLAAEFPPAEFEVHEIVLVSSTLASGGSIYAPVATVALGGGRGGGAASGAARGPAA